jgi:hypothetical protein
MAKVVESAAVAGRHLHSGISLPPPALCETWPAPGGHEEFDFLVPQRRLRRFAAIGGIATAAGLLGLLSLLASNDAPRPAPIADSSKLTPANQVTVATTDKHMSADSEPVPQAELAATPIVSPPAVTETSPPPQTRKSARRSARSKFGGTRAIARRR